MKNAPNRNVSKNSCVLVCLCKDFFDSGCFLPEGTKIYVFPGRNLLFSLIFFLPLREIRFLRPYSFQCPMIATMTEAEMERKNMTGKGRLIFLEAGKLFLALSPAERKIIWPQTAKR